MRWLKKLSPFAYAIEALCLGEYPGMTFNDSKTWFSKVRDLPRMGGLAMVENGDQVIEALGLVGQTYGNAMQHLGVLCGGYLVLSWVGLAVQYWIPRLQRAASERKHPRRRQQPGTGPTEHVSSAQSGPKHLFKAPTRLKM